MYSRFELLEKLSEEQHEYQREHTHSYHTKRVKTSNEIGICRQTVRCTAWIIENIKKISHTLYISK